MSHNKDRQQGFTGVRNAEIVGTMPGLKVQLGIGLLIVAALLFGYFVWQKAVYQTSVATEQTATTTLSDMQGVVEKLLENKNANLGAVSTAAAGSNAASTMTVRLAVLADPDLFDFANNVKRNCDSVIMVPTTVPASPLMLQASINALLTDTFDYGFKPANFIATQKALSLASARIVDGIATINLTGSVNATTDSCEATRIQTQLTETARQFGNVKQVNIFLNGKPL
jgi:hypothetical protein